MSYQEFVASKRPSVDPVGWDVDPSSLHPSLFEHQRMIVRWATILGRSAVFADTGLGKTRMEIEWARLCSERSGRPSVILAPLAVVAQTMREAAAMGYRAGSPGSGSGVVVTNYDQAHKLTPDDYGAVVLDESSILKSFTGATRTAMIEMWRDTPMRMAATATPAPNDHTELGNHAEFLSVCTRAEMLSEYFVHDGGETQAWRLKGHARREFWRWVSTWAVLLRSPRDIGVHDDRYDLPPLVIEDHAVPIDHGDAHAGGQLFVTSAVTLSDQRVMERATVHRRAVAAAEIANAADEPVIVWCYRNDESSEVAALVPDAVEVTGSMSPEEKADRLNRFSVGEFRVMVTKPSIAGFGLNWQHCARQVFIGPTHSYEQFYQSVRRSWRFGQARPVRVTILSTAASQAVSVNLRAKAERADEMAAEMIAEVAETQLASIRASRPGIVTGSNRPTMIPRWLREGGPPCP